MSERQVTHRIFVGGLGLAAGIIGATGVEWVQAHDSAADLLPNCNIAAPDLAPSAYKPDTAERLLGVEPESLRYVHFFAAACLTLMSKTTLEKGVDIGPQRFGDQGRYRFDDCVAYAADKPLVPAEGLKRSQIVIACDGLKIARQVLEA